MPDSATRPVLVVGAGPTGLVMAAELARHGAPVRLVEKLEQPLPFARANGIHPRTLEVFQDLGIVDAFLARGQPVRAIQQYANGRPFLRIEKDGVDSPFPHTIGLEQSKTEAILEAHLAGFGVRVERGTEFVDLAEHLDGVHATLRHADGRHEVLDVPWLVGCDGAHSRVRHVNRQHFPGEADPHAFLVADVLFDAGFEDGEVTLHFTDDGLFWRFPLPAGRSLVIADLPEDVPEDPPAGATAASADTPAAAPAPVPEPTPGMLQALIDGRVPGRPRARDLRWLSGFRIHYRLTPHYRHGRTFLAGDAAHVHSPVSGQGMNTGIQDAYNLAWKLAGVVRGHAPETLLDSYERERRAVAADVLATTRAATERAEAFAALDPARRDRLFLHATVPAAELRRAARHEAELDLDYRRSPVCHEHLGHAAAGAATAAGPHAGAEARDVAPISFGGGHGSLFELLRGPHHTLLLFAGREAGAADDAALDALAAEIRAVYGEHVRVWLVAPDAREAGWQDPASAPVARDPSGALHERYGAGRPCLYVIRPDGYVGFRAAPPSVAALRDHLARVLVAPAGA